ncbi:hypothetical protein [Ferrimonas senticii]|uniref:hypothetical protein n=1 Tax=Ferrimonas senticii TaxID=394566 RepID=UPI0004247597|nr:hypothetical protein [Ferrimonas senticii]
MTKPLNLKKTAKASKQAAKLLQKAFAKQLKQQLEQGLDLTAIDKARSKQLVQGFIAQLQEQGRQESRIHFPHHGIVLTKPWKNKPCSNCPALEGHLCKCALKQAKKVRLGS